MKTETSSDVIYGKVLNRDVGTIARMEQSRIISFIASTGTKDRHGHVVNQANWDLSGFRANPVIGYQHQLHPEMCVKSSPDDVIGKAMNVRVDGDILLLDIWFETEDMNPLAEKVFKKLLKGTLNAVSVGFLAIPDEKGMESRRGNKKNGEDPTAEYLHGQELLEVSVVNIPANKEALQKAVRDTTANALMFVKRQLNKSFTEIEAMTVKQVVDLIEGKKPDNIENNIEDNVGEEISEPIEVDMADTIDANADKSVSSMIEIKLLELKLKQRQIEL